MQPCGCRAGDPSGGAVSHNHRSLEGQDRPSAGMALIPAVLGKYAVRRHHGDAVVLSNVTSIANDGQLDHAFLMKGREISSGEAKLTVDLGIVFA